MNKTIKTILFLVLTLIILFVLFIIFNKNELDYIGIETNKDKKENITVKANYNLKEFDCIRANANIEDSSDKNFGYDYYGKNGEVFFYNLEIESPTSACNLLSADYNTFEVLDFIYARDKSHVFYRHFELLKADPATFEIVIEGGLAKDKDSVYLFGQILPGIDSESLEDIGYTYMKTKDGIFMRNYDFEAEKIEEADPETFEVIDGGSYDAKDKNNYYKDGLVVDLK